MAEQPKYYREIVIGALLIGAALAVYLPVIYFDFTNYDDPAYILENIPVLAGLNWESIQWAFTHSHSGNWHPLTWMSHMLDCQLYGTNASGHHLTSVVFHCLNTLVLYGMLRSLTGAMWRSVFVAGLFALHPLHVESVAWVAERKDVLSGGFGLLCLWAYGAYVKTRADLPEPAPGKASFRRGPRPEAYYALSLALFALGLMCKPMLVTWPCLMLVLDYWPLRRLPRAGETQTRMALRLVGEKIPFFALSVAGCFITFLTQQGAGALAPLNSAPMAARISNAVTAYFLYIKKLAWPTRLSVIYLDTGTSSAVFVLVASLVLVALTVLVWRLRRSRPYLLTGYAWYLGTLVPVIGIIKVGNQSMADRYSYLPAIGLFIMLAWGVAELSSARHGRTVIGTFAGAMLAAAALLAQNQLRVWQNTETLFRHAIAVTENNYIAYNSLAFYLADLGESRQADSWLRASLSINPNSAPAWNKLGSVLVKQERYTEAISNCLVALRINPGMPEAHTTLGLALLKQGQTNEALGHYAEALRLSPDYAPAHYNLANALAKQGQYENAREHYEASLRSDPYSADAHNNLAYLLAREKRLDEAIAHFRIALHRQPGSWQARYGLGEVLAKQGRFAEAGLEYSEVVRQRPELAIAHFQLAVSLVRQGKISEALSSITQARRYAAQTGQQELARKSQELQERLEASRVTQPNNELRSR